MSKLISTITLRLDSTAKTFSAVVHTAAYIDGAIGIETQDENVVVGDDDTGERIWNKIKTITFKHAQKYGDEFGS